MAKVTIYTTPTCIYCKAAKEYFTENNIEYEEKNVAQDRVALDEMVKKSEQMGVPVFDINGSIVVGFDHKTIASLLGLSK